MSKTTRRRSLRQLLRREDGVTAVEFALVAPMFLVFLLGIIDLSAYFSAANQLQTAVEQAARSIRVGDTTVVGADIPMTPTKKDVFRNLVCSFIHTHMIRDCTSKLVVDVRNFASDFSGVSYPGITDTNSDGVIDNKDGVYSAGVGGDAVIARAYYDYSFIVPQMGILTGGTPSSHQKVAITAVTAFRNEPFGP